MPHKPYGGPDHNPLLDHNPSQLQFRTTPAHPVPPISHSTDPKLENSRKRRNRERRNERRRKRERIRNERRLAQYQEQGFIYGQDARQRVERWIEDVVVESASPWAQDLAEDTIALEDVSAPSETSRDEDEDAINDVHVPDTHSSPERPCHKLVPQDNAAAPEAMNEENNKPRKLFELLSVRSFTPFEPPIESPKSRLRRYDLSEWAPNQSDVDGVYQSWGSSIRGSDKNNEMHLVLNGERELPEEEIRAFLDKWISSGPVEWILAQYLEPDPQPSDYDSEGDLRSEFNDKYALDVDKELARLDRQSLVWAFEDLLGNCKAELATKLKTDLYCRWDRHRMDLRQERQRMWTLSRRVRSFRTFLDSIVGDIKTCSSRARQDKASWKILENDLLNKTLDLTIVAFEQALVKPEVGNWKTQSNCLLTLLNVVELFLGVLSNVKKHPLRQNIQFVIRESLLVEATKSLAKEISPIGRKKIRQVTGKHDYWDKLCRLSIRVQEYPEFGGFDDVIAILESNRKDPEKQLTPEPPSFEDTFFYRRNPWR